VARALYTENREYVDMVKSNLGQQTDGRRPDVSVGFLNASARQFDPLASIGLAPSALHQKHILQVGSLFGLVLLALIRRCRPYIFTAGRQISDMRWKCNVYSPSGRALYATPGVVRFPDTLQRQTFADKHT